ncbi:MAG: hypothetical protein E2O52_04310 [Gammaproteobacteria bacterium]|nr:MAG: hypothetical protein E2O52_04310 [Gammaproteobacteria bacterium]
MDLTVMFACCVSLVLVLALQPPGVPDQAKFAHIAAIPSPERILPTSQIVAASHIMLAANAADPQPYLLLP